mmetsp:Transcript_11728/g.33108  ORF Transcript_11728/g.33108 Transcript_11728/m.33108 type:complete len:273 (-) Transcript_11728:231-1049(-)
MKRIVASVYGGGQQQGSVPWFFRGGTYFGSRGAAHDTDRMRLAYPNPSRVSMAACASSRLVKLIKANPLLSPVSRSFAMKIRCTCPNLPKRSDKSCSTTSSARLVTRTLFSSRRFCIIISPSPPAPRLRSDGGTYPPLEPADGSPDPPWYSSSSGGTSTSSSPLAASSWRSIRFLWSSSRSDKAADLLSPALETWKSSRCLSSCDCFFDLTRSKGTSSGACAVMASVGRSVAASPNLTQPARFAAVDVYTFFSTLTTRLFVSRFITSPFSFL